MIYSLHFPDRDPDNALDSWIGWAQFTWYCKYRPLGLRISAVVCAVFSLIVVLCELAFYLQLQNNPLNTLFYEFSYN